MKAMKNSVMEVTKLISKSKGRTSCNEQQSNL